ncbi:MAG: Asp-tRNA(Asn)/Glu-tRNA(Gln) amidotransferase subunit GatA [Candidatus Saccharimonadales bacterium]
MSWPTLSELVAELKAGQRSVEAVVSESLKRAEAAVDFHALLELNPAALERAKSLDADLAAGVVPGPLFGVPCIVKDNFLTSDTKTTAASKILETFQAPYQATAVERLEAAGAIVIAKANLDEFAQGSSTENSAFGPSKNPHDKSRVPGGSSGGSAAVVALGIVPFALGTDTGGSIRQPASFCGVVGYKPTYGLVSRYGVVAMASSCDVVGPITNSVSDAAYVLDVLAGPDPRDSTTIEREVDYTVTRPADLRGLRVGVIAEHLSETVEPGVKQELGKAVDKLKANGAVVSDIKLPLDKLALAVYYIIVPAEISSNLARYDGVKYGLSVDSANDLLETYLQTRGAGFGAEPLRRILTGTYVLSSGYQEAYYQQAQKVRTLIREDYARIFSDYDVILGPTVATTAFELGAKQDPLSMYLSDSMTIATNLAGIPAISLPAGESDGLPVGLQLQAAQRQDKRLLEVAAALEDIL